MTAEEIVVLVSTAFADVPRPDVFTSGCTCSECKAVDKSLQSCGSKLPDGLEWELSLLSPAAIRYLTPALIRESLAESEDDLAWNFVEMLGTPVSKTNPPDSLPFAIEFNGPQVRAVLEFLRFIRAEWYDDSEEPPRELLRGLRNWEHFADRGCRRTT